MLRSTMLLITLSATAAGLDAQDRHAPYAGFEQRPIKALSAEQIESYLNGDGMGFALAAELNHYPGPRHVLELDSDLSLTDEQRRATKRIFDEMKFEAVKVGQDIVAKEQLLDSLFATTALDDPTLNTVLMDIASLNGALRYVHLRAHLAMKHILTDDQVRRYDEIRGYGSEHDERHRHGGNPSM